MGHKCGACNTPVEHNVNGQVYQPLGIVTAWCNPCIKKYDTLTYGCNGCGARFDPNMEGVVGEGSSYCGPCCEAGRDEMETFVCGCCGETLPVADRSGERQAWCFNCDRFDREESDWADRIANGATFMEA